MHLSALPWKSSHRMDGHLVIGLLIFKHVLILLLLLCFVFVQTHCAVWLYFRTAICINRYNGWNILNIFLYLKKAKNGGSTTNKYRSAIS